MVARFGIEYDIITDNSPRFMPDAPRVFQLPAKRGAGYAVVRIYAIG